MSDDFGRMRPLSLRFGDPDLEASFAEEQARKAARLFRMAAVLGGAIIVFWAGFDYVVPMAGRPRGQFSLAMLLWLLPVYVAGYLFSYSSRFFRHQQRVTLTGFCLVSVALAGMASRMPSEMFPGILAIVCVHILGT